MAQQYASNQPAGFKNHIENVAIVGATGSIGSYITKSLLATGKHTVSALTRIDGTSKIPDGVIAKKVDYNNHSSLVEALKGQQVLIITLGVMAPPDTHSKLVEAAAAAKVPLVIPNNWGFDKDVTLDGPLGGMLAKMDQDRKLISSLGMTWIAFTCGFWYEFSLSGSEYRYGFDFANKKVTFFDDGETKINTSSWPLCGKAVANLLAMKLLPEDEVDKSTTIMQFKDSHVNISSFLISQKDMFAAVLRCTGDKESDWKIKYENSKERYEAGMKMMQQGNREGFAQLMYTRVLYPDGVGNYQARRGLANKDLGLAEEDLDHYTNIAIEMAKAPQAY